MLEIVEPWALPCLLAGVGGTLVALLIFLQRPSAIQNRAVALFVWLTSIGWALDYGFIAVGFVDGAANALRKTAYFGWTLASLAYLWTLSTLDSPIGRKLAKPTARTVYTVGILCLAAVIAATSFSRWYVSAGRDFIIGLVAVSLFGIVVAVAAWRNAPPGLVRRKNAAFALAFAVYDASIAIFYGFFLARDAFSLPDDFVGIWVLAVPGVAALVFQGLLLYGILSAQLFDIDLKIKWGLRRGTLVGAFLGVFVVVAAVVEQWLQQYGVLLGGVAVGVMLLALRPIERAADRLADHAMPRVQDTPEYRTVRKREVYRAAVESALIDGSLSEKDRGVLATLAQQLDIGAKDAHDIEREARAGLA